MGLADYKEIVGQIASIATMGHMLSGTLICRDMYRKKTSNGIDPMPFAGGIGMSILMLQFARILGDPAMINVNIFGLMTNVLYMTVYYYYSSHMKDTVVILGKIAVFVAVILGYVQWEDPDKLEHRYGIIITIIFITLVASPLVHVKEVIRTKNTDILPFPMILMGTIVFSLWLLYGIIIDNGIIVNCVNLVLSAAQLSLFVIFPSGGGKTKSGKKEH